MKVSKVLEATSSEWKDTNTSNGKRLTASTKKRPDQITTNQGSLSEQRMPLPVAIIITKNIMNPTDDRGDSIDKMDENKDHNVEVINIEDTKNLKCHPEASNKDKERFRKAMLKQKKIKAEQQQKMKERLEAEELKRKGMTRQLLKKQQDHNTNNNHAAPNNKLDENVGRTGQIHCLIWSFKHITYLKHYPKFIISINYEVRSYSYTNTMYIFLYIYNKIYEYFGV